MSFISGADLSAYCPNVEESTLNTVASDIDALFCSLLPLKSEQRTVKFRDDEVFYQYGWNKVNTTLFNITAVTINDIVIGSDDFKVDGNNNSSVRFKETPTFDPVFEMLLTSGYDSNALPYDLKKAMIMMGTDSALSIGVATNVKAYSLGPRSVTFKDDGVAQLVTQVLNSYLSL